MVIINIAANCSSSVLGPSTLRYEDTRVKNLQSRHLAGSNVPSLMISVAVETMEVDYRFSIMETKMLFWKAAYTYGTRSKRCLMTRFCFATIADKHIVCDGAAIFCVGKNTLP